MKIAMIGAGGMAPRHLNILTSEPGIEVVGHVSPFPEELAAAVRRWGGRGYASCKDLLQHEEVNAAWITVPPGSHGEIEMSLIERGIPFFVEKPLSADRRTGEEIAATVASKGIIAGVGYHWRAMDTIPEVKRTLAGKPAHMVCAAWHDATPPPVWWRHQATSGGQMVEQATHLFDIARFLVGEACVTAAAAGRHERPKYPDADVDDVSAALLRFNGGAIGVFTATCLLGGNAAVYVQLMCEGLLITVTQGGVTYDTGRERREVRVGSDPGVAEDRAFLEAVRRNDPTLLFSSYADALLSHRLTHDVLEASR